MNVYWANWSGNVTCNPRSIITTHSESAIARLVREASLARLPVRVAGSGHSFTPLCATTGTLLSLDGFQGLVDSSDVSADEVTVWAGSKLFALGDPLWACGLAMANLGDIDRQALAGALNTGTHGTGRTLGNIATQVTALRLVSAAGELIDCSPEQEPALFKAAQVGLGALGVITRATLRLLPAYYLHERTWVATFDECMAELDELIAGNRHFEFFWLPQADRCAMKTLNPAQPDQAVAPSAGPAVTGRLTRYVQPERVDRSYRIFPSERNLKFNELEFAVPAEQGAECLRELRQLMQSNYREVQWPLEYRTVAADDIWLSPAYGRATVTISVHQAAELPYERFFADAAAIFRNHQGRPHWGKIHPYTARQLRDLYPRWSDFLAVREQFDPQQLLLNEYVGGLLL